MLPPNNERVSINRYRRKSDCTGEFQGLNQSSSGPRLVARCGVSALPRPLAHQWRSMPPAGGHTLHRRPNPTSPPPRDGGKNSPCRSAPGRIPASSSPRSRKPPAPELLDRLLEGIARAEGGYLLG